MVSERKLAANRANALKSTGPRSEEGKLRVSRNAISHGITACGESLVQSVDYQQMLSSLKADLAPADCVQEVIVERIAATSVRLQRLQRAEQMFLVGECAHQREKDGNDDIPLDESVGWFLALESGDLTIERLQRYEIALNRILYNSFRELRQQKSGIGMSIDLFRRQHVQPALGTPSSAPLQNKATDAGKPLPSVQLQSNAKPRFSTMDLLKSLEDRPDTLLSQHWAKKGRASPRG